jgi:carbonic anhydrase/acetyltransferase-like protein (isoleucine patch superfamily)
MLLEHQGKRPRIHDTAYIAPTATVLLFPRLRPI